MNLNTVIFEGNLTNTPGLNKTATTGTSVDTAVVLINRRIKNEEGQWTDAEPTRYRIKALAEHMATLPKGATVLVTGTTTTTTNTWTDKTTEQKRTQDTVNVDAIGASLRFRTVQVETAGAREGGN